MAIDKNAPGLNIQDAFVTFRPFGEVFKIDAGFMLPPLSHNSLESAAKLYGHDYFANTFRRNLFGIADPFRGDGESPIGRDAGVQAARCSCSTATSMSASACSWDTGSAWFRRAAGPAWSAD